jgi:hypothetical protein
MSWMAKAGLAAALLNCGLLNASADTSQGQWLKDSASNCALYSAGATAGDTVSWAGDCADGKANGLGTATFTHGGISQSFTAQFTGGVIPDGHVITRWGKGWSYDGEEINGVFSGAGILTTDASDRFEGQWVDGKMNGFGVLRRASGERYSGDWKNDRPNGMGQLWHVDGTAVSGTFVDGKLAQTDQRANEQAAEETSDAPVATQAVAKSMTADTAKAPFGGVSGKTLIGVDGSSIALNLIEGGMELQVIPADAGAAATARKTTFTYMTDRMGTVVEDSGVPGAGTSVTGFFRLTGKGVEIRYADGRSAMLSSNGDGGVQMALDGDSGASCRSWYPAGHAFSETDKKAALNAYASKLGLPVTANVSGSVAGNACSASPAPVAKNAAPPAAAAAPQSAPPQASALKARPERHAALKAPAHIAKASYRIGDYQPRTLDAVTVKTSEIHTVDGAIVVPNIGETVAATAPAAPTRTAGKSDASNCLKVGSDGSHWGFRNGCDFAVQFAYCMAGSSDSLTACGAQDAVTSSVTGSVAANGFGALMADTSLSDKDASHNFRWIACGGGAGEVVAHLDHFEPPAGRCERTRTASN